MKQRRPWIDFGIYLVVRGIVATVQALPEPAGIAFSELLAKLAYRIDKRHREVARENLRLAFPEDSPERIDQLVRGCYAHFCRIVIEMIHLPRKLRVHNWRRFAETEGWTEGMRLLLEREPVLIVLAHFGNWELAGYALGNFGFRTFAIARVLDNPHLEQFLKQFRQATGQTIIAKKDDFDRLESVLRAGGKVATLADQDAGQRGVFVNFFGRPASAHKAVALMALEFRTKIIVLATPRGADGKYRIQCRQILDPQAYETRPDAIRALTQDYHAILEAAIREYPEQYFWLHRRWKTQPAPRRGKASTAATST
ncbi:MAG: lysophospholipid acyltransferase family protein [Gemmataceae bacterium]